MNTVPGVAPPLVSLRCMYSIFGVDLASIFKRSLIGVRQALFQLYRADSAAVGLLHPLSRLQTTDARVINHRNFVSSRVSSPVKKLVWD
jgi:hypothetical protein